MDWSFLYILVIIKRLIKLGILSKRYRYLSYKDSLDITRNIYPCTKQEELPLICYLLIIINWDYHLQTTNGEEHIFQACRVLIARARSLISCIELCIFCLEKGWIFVSRIENVLFKICKKEKILASHCICNP